MDNKPLIVIVLAIAFVALVLPFASLEGLLGQDTCGLFFRSKGVTALVRTGSVAGITEVSGGSRARRGARTKRGKQ